MTRVLLTGGSGFLAAHVLDALLARGHSVVTTVRSLQKAQQIAAAHPRFNKEQLDYAIVEDIAKPDAFDKAVVSEPPFDTVIHTASPFHYNATDVKKDLYDPAVNGTVGILHAIKKNAPTVKRVVITSSFAAMLNSKKPKNENYSEDDHNPETESEGLADPRAGYRVSKTLAENAAWDFMSSENPSFTLVVLNPPLILGPIAHHLSSLSDINTSNTRFRDIINGSCRAKSPPTGSLFWVDVRDLGVAHVLAAESAKAANNRFFVTAGPFSNKEIVEFIAEAYPEYRDKLPQGEEALAPGAYGSSPQCGYDNTKSVQVLGMEYRSLGECVRDTVKSLQAIPA